MDPCQPEGNFLPELTLPVHDGLDLLPCEIPKPPRLAFTGPGEGWPPRPVGQCDVRFLEAEAIPGALTEAFEAEVRRAALEDRLVRELLGERFVHIHTDELNSGKGRDCDMSRPLGTRLVFFSHTNNVAVEVEMQGLRVGEALTVPRFQPPEAMEEIEEAISIARADPRLSHHVRDLEAGALINMLNPEDPYHGLRVLWVTFFEAGEREEEKPALFCAAVDIVNRRVLTAREEPALQRPEGRNDEGYGEADHA
jgi:hypothetical protein